MENNPLSILAKIAAIIACIVAVLGYFNIYPSCSRLDVRNYIEELTEDKNEQSDSEITKGEQKEQTDFNISFEEYVIWKNMTFWDRIKLPFTKHKKMNYIKRDWKEHGWKAILVYVGVIFALLLCMVFLFVIIEEFDNDYFFLIVYLVAIIYLIASILSNFGIY